MLFDRNTSWAAILTYLVFLLVMIVAWFTHVVVCIKSASWIFLLAGAIFVPVGITHGIGIWFGWF